MFSAQVLVPKMFSARVLVPKTVGYHVIEGVEGRVHAVGQGETACHALGGFYRVILFIWLEDLMKTWKMKIWRFFQQSDFQKKCFSNLELLSRFEKYLDQGLYLELAKSFRAIKIQKKMILETVNLVVLGEWFWYLVFTRRMKYLMISVHQNISRFFFVTSKNLGSILSIADLKPISGYCLIQERSLSKIPPEVGKSSCFPN